MHNTPIPAMPVNSPVTVSNVDSSVDSSPQEEMSESEGEIWPDNLNVVDDYAHDCDSVDLNVVEPDLDPSPPVITSEGYHYNN